MLQSMLWPVRAHRCVSPSSVAALALTLVLLTGAMTAAERCPQHCVCADSVQTFELTCTRNHKYNLSVEIQPGYYYNLECDLSDEQPLDPTELVPLRVALGEYNYNSSAVRRCVLPARPLVEMLVALHPAADTELLFVKLDEPRGVVLDSIGLAALHHFMIVHAPISELPPALFTAPAMDHLVIRQTRESLRLDVDALRQTTEGSRLRTLELSLDNINNLPPLVFVHLSELRRLYLWGNKLEAITSDSFTGLTNLEALDLSRNRLKTLPQELCKGIPMLRSINLYDNPLTVVPEDVFANCSVLEALNLGRGQLKSLPFNIFFGLNALQNLSIASQKLETLSVKLFQDQHNLRRLNLSGNRLARVAPNIFIALGRLTHLSLDDNRLVDLESGVFSGLNAIEELSVERNLLKRVAADAFRGAGATQLRRLRLARNQLTLAEGSIGNASPLRALTGLQRLELAYNRLDLVYEDWRVSMLQLNFLDLSHNRFTFLSDLDVNFLTTKIDIDFRYNDISMLNFSMSNAYGSEGDSISSDVAVLLDNNPLRCDCEIYAAVLRAATVASRLRIVWGRAKCTGPPTMDGIPLAALSADNFTCELDSCTVANCTCRARPVHRILEVKCIGAVELPHFKPAVVGHQWHLERTELFLNGNAIDSLGPQDPEPDVSVLDLRNNQISWLDAAAVRRLFAPRRVLWLAGNPLKCKCDNEPLLTALREHRHRVQDYELLRCDGDGEFIQNLPPGGVCLGYTVAIAAALALSAAIMAALVLLYRRFESEVKIWLYARGLCLRWLTEEELDRDKCYDAFVSFSHLDEPFVVGQLVPTLETGPHPLRLCVHVRDWPAGEWIPAQITRSVEQSCRTIVVLSSNFLESVWGRVEFRAAHAAALREGRARVVVVLYGEALDARRLDPELRAYLATNTYIKWGDPYFWHKLRLELPHRRSSNRLVQCAPPLTDLVAARKAGFQDGLELSPAPTTPAPRF